MDTIFTNQTPGTDDLDFITHFFGTQYQVSAPREVFGGRAWVPVAGRPPTFFWQLWRVSDQLLLAEVDLNSPGFGTPPGGAWLSFTSANFITPGNIAQAAGVGYVSGLFSDDGHFTYTDPGTFPIGTGVVSASNGRFRTGGLRTDFPTGTSATLYGFGDVSVDVSGASALPGTHVAGGSSSTLTASAAAAASLAASGSQSVLTASGTP